MLKRFSPIPCSICVLMFVMQPVSADPATTGMPLKARGVGVELYTQTQDVKITDISIKNPMVATLLPANAKDLVTINNDLKMVGAKLDYQVNPHLTVFGGISQVSGEATANLSALPGLGLSDLVFDADGTLYNVGATVAKQQGRYFGALTYIYTHADGDAGVQDGAVNTLIPSVGVLTEVGAFNAGLMYQQADIDYAGTLVLPVLGEVATEVRGETADTLAYRVGYQAQLGRDLYLDASVGFGGLEDARLELNHHF